MSAAASPLDPEVVFVGGTGRSGTHAIARLLGRHSRFCDIPIEARFHCNKRGLPDLLEGRITLRSYLAKLRGFWWHRVRVDGQPRGLYNLITEHRFEAAVERFAAGFEDDPLAASRGLFGDLLGPFAERRGSPILVEMSSHNVKEAQTLLRIFPRARIVHALRDGRDSADSVTTKTWGPATAIAAVGWWQSRLREVERGVRGEEDGAAYSLPADRFRVVLLDDLAVHDRERAYAGLLDFVGVEDEPPIRDHFDRDLTPAAAHVGRWREGAGPIGRWRIRRRYERALSELASEGNHAAPALLRAFERSDGRPARSGS